MVLSCNPDNPPQMAALFGSSLALSLGGVPIEAPIAGVIVGRVNGEFIEVKILDSSFVAYLIMRGILWVLGVLSWLSIAIWRALKERDFAIPFLASIIIIGYSFK